MNGTITLISHCTPRYTHTHRDTHIHTYFGFGRKLVQASCEEKVLQEKKLHFIRRLLLQKDFFFHFALSRPLSLGWSLYALQHTDHRFDPLIEAK